MFALPIFAVRGSDASAAGGRFSELSDCRRSGVQASNRCKASALSESQWQRSVDGEGACRQRRYRAPQQEAIVLPSASVQWTHAGSCSNLTDIEKAPHLGVELCVRNAYFHG